MSNSNVCPTYHRFRAIYAWTFQCTRFQYVRLKVKSAWHISLKLGSRTSYSEAHMSAENDASWSSRLFAMTYRGIHIDAWHTQCLIAKHRSTPSERCKKDWTLYSVKSFVQSGKNRIYWIHVCAYLVSIIFFFYYVCDLPFFGIKHDAAFLLKNPYIFW